MLHRRVSIPAAIAGMSGLPLILVFIGFEVLLDLAGRDLRHHDGGADNIGGAFLAFRHCQFPSI